MTLTINQVMDAWEIRGGVYDADENGDRVYVANFTYQMPLTDDEQRSDAASAVLSALLRWSEVTTR